MSEHKFRAKLRGLFSRSQPASPSSEASHGPSSAKGSPAASSRELRQEHSASTAPLAQDSPVCLCPPTAPTNDPTLEPAQVLPAALNRQDSRLGGGTEAAHAAQAAPNAATRDSLWDRAYDALKEDTDKRMADRISQYEDLLSQVLAKAQTTAPSSPQDAQPSPNQLRQHDVASRREQLKAIATLGLRHMEDKKVSVTLLGHELVLQDQVKNVAVAAEWAEDYIKDAIKDLPYASIVWAGVALILPLLKSPSAAEAANREGFTYVTSQIRYYAAMESLLLPEGMKPDLRADLEDRLVELYKLIIDFQVQSILRFYRSRTKNFLRGMITYDNWQTMLQGVKDAGAALVQKFETAMSGAGLDIAGHSLRQLEKLAREAEASRKVLEDNLVHMADDLREIRRMQQEQFRQQMSDKDHKCMQDILLSDPRRDKTRIEQTKGGLLGDCYKWILSHPDFLRWRDEEQSRLLWIKGDAGKGKAMLLIGIINEIPRLSISDGSLLSFFLCQGTNAALNSATAVLRGLIYLLIIQDGRLVSHLRTEHDRAGQKLLEGTNAFHALSTIFEAMLRDTVLTQAFLVVDALDECESDLPQLLDLIARTSVSSSRAKWIVSSRNRPDIERQLDPDKAGVRLSLEVNAKLVDHAIDVYISHKITELRSISGDPVLQTQVREQMRQKASGTFLWVALVFKELRESDDVDYENTSDILQVLDDMPADLPELYSRMLQQIAQLKKTDPQYCYSVLSVTVLAYQPLHLRELPIIAGLRGRLAEKHTVERCVNKCGSFLTIRDDYVYLIHQSAKDFLTTTKTALATIFPTGPGLIHFDIFSRSLCALSNTLRRDIYDLNDPGLPIDQVKVPTPDPLEAVRYSSVFWIQHFCEVDNQESNCNRALSDTGTIASFLHKHFIHWIESLSLLRKMSGAILSIRELSRAVQSSYESNTALAAFLKDAEKYALFASR